jgi:hypothetical protein
MRFYIWLSYDDISYKYLYFIVITIHLYYCCMNEEEYDEKNRGEI